jgi:hypothetical protein
VARRGCRLELRLPQYVHAHRPSEAWPDGRLTRRRKRTKCGTSGRLRLCAAAQCRKKCVVRCVAPCVCTLHWVSGKSQALRGLPLFECVAVVEAEVFAERRDCLVETEFETGTGSAQSRHSELFTLAAARTSPRTAQLRA